jgi:serine/threonine protein kinase
MAIIRSIVPAAHAPLAPQLEPRFKKRKVPIAPVTIPETYEDLLQKYGVGSPLKQPNGAPCQGTYKVARKTREIQKVAVMASPHKTTNPALYARVAEQELAIHSEVADGPHIPQLFARFSTPGQRYASIQQNIGVNLFTAYLDKANPAVKILQLPTLERLCKQLLEATQHLHARGILHGDIKPENAGEQGHLYDFGLSEKIGDKLTREIKYSRFYRPPETFFQSQTALSGDVWALGCLFFELFAKMPLIPVGDPRTREEAITVDINMVNAFQERLGTAFNVDILHAIFPHVIAVDPSGQKSLKPSTLGKLKPFYEQIFEYSTDLKFQQFADLLQKMLRVNPLERLTVREALAHPFFTSETCLDHSFQLEVTGNREMGIRVLHHSGRVLETIDLSTWRPSSCYHIVRSGKPYQLEFYRLGQPDVVVHRCPLSLKKDRDKFSIDTDTFSVRSVRESGAAAAAAV